MTRPLSPRPSGAVSCGPLGGVDGRGALDPSPKLCVESNWCRKTYVVPRAEATSSMQDERGLAAIPPGRSATLQDGELPQPVGRPLGAPRPLASLT